MRKPPLLGTAVALLLSLAGCVPSAFEKMSRLERDLRLSVGREAPGARLSLWLARADGRELLAIDADRPVPGASLLKVLILVEAHAQARAGSFAWTDNYTLLSTDLVGGTGSFQRERVGSSWTYLQFARRMISESDNVAANVLLRRLGMASVNARAASLGLRVTRFEREFMDFEAQREGRENWTTAREIGSLLRAIFRRELLTPDACDAMIASLERTSRGRIAAGVPKDVAVGHKSGVMAGGYSHDAGWVRVPGQPYVLSVLLEGVLPPREDGEDRGQAALEAVGRLVYDAIGPTDE
ncbi:MAG: serine hydrolase [Planctomycetaceae bacterium]|nr:serine hydrolase [Planctomycetaceae bacterium]